MKMAKPSERDVDAAGNLMSLLLQLDRGDYPVIDEDADVPDWFDKDNPEHLRAFYDAFKATLDKAPGYPGRVIGGMCYVIMYDKNEIVDPASDVIELHPKLVKALAAAEASAQAAADVHNAITNYVADNWPMRKYSLEEIETRLRSIDVSALRSPAGEDKAAGQEGGAHV